MAWLITALALTGTVANVYKKRWCFWVWLVSNGCWAIIDWRHGLYAQAALFMAYMLLAVWGLVRWKK